MNKYSKAARNDRPIKKRSRSPPHHGAPSSPRRESCKRKGDVVTLFPPQQMQPMYTTMPWAPPASDSQFQAWENGGFWMQCHPMPYQPHFQGEGSSRVPIFDRLRKLVHDRLGQHQSGQGQYPGPVSTNMCVHSSTPPLVFIGGSHPEFAAHLCRTDLSKQQGGAMWQS